jgi:hypothetical protein
MPPPVKNTVLLDGTSFDWEHPDVHLAKQQMGDALWRHYTEEVGSWHGRKSVFARLFPDINVAASIINEQRRLGLYDSVNARKGRVGEILTDLRTEWKVRNGLFIKDDEMTVKMDMKQLLSPLTFNGKKIMYLTDEERRKLWKHQFERLASHDVMLKCNQHYESEKYNHILDCLKKRHQLSMGDMMKDEAMVLNEMVELGRLLKKDVSAYERRLKTLPQASIRKETVEAMFDVQGTQMSFSSDIADSASEDNSVASEDDEETVAVGEEGQKN